MQMLKRVPVGPLGYFLARFWFRFDRHQHQRWEWCQAESELVSWPNAVHQPPPAYICIALINVGRRIRSICITVLCNLHGNGVLDDAREGAMADIPV